MPNFCGKCGNKLEETDVFCGKCGKSNNGNNIGSNNINLKEEKITKDDMKTKYLFAGLLAVVLLCSGGYYFYSKYKAEPVSQIPVVENNKSENVKTEPLQKEKSSIDKTTEILTTKGIVAEVLATTLGNNKDGTLALVKKDNQTKFIVIDNIDNAVAEIPYSNELYNLGKEKDSVITFKMTIFNDVRGNDSVNGVWKGKDHLLPIYAHFTINNSGEIIPGMLTTGMGESPAHLQAYLQETKNVNLANLVLTEMKKLRELDRSNI